MAPVCRLGGEGCKEMIGLFPVDYQNAQYDVEALPEATRFALATLSLDAFLGNSLLRQSSRSDLGNRSPWIPCTCTTTFLPRLIGPRKLDPVYSKARFRSGSEQELCELGLPLHVEI